MCVHKKCVLALFFFSWKDLCYVRAIHYYFYFYYYYYYYYCYYYCHYYYYYYITIFFIKVVESLICV